MDLKLALYRCRDLLRSYEDSQWFQDHVGGLAMFQGHQPLFSSPDDVLDVYDELGKDAVRAELQALWKLASTLSCEYTSRTLGVNHLIFECSGTYSTSERHKYS